MKKNISPLYLALIGITCSGIAHQAAASSIGWGSETTGGSWSTAGNWNPSTAAPTAADIANLDNAIANRVVIYDTAASGTLNTLNITENSGFLNQLTLYRNLGAANAITLASTSGTSAIFLDTSLGSAGTTGAGINLTASGGVTINSGGLLSFIVSGASNNLSPVVNGDVTLNSGGQLIMYKSYSNSVAGMATLNNNFTMTGGTLTLGADYGSYANVNNNRVLINGNVNISGGAINNVAGGNLRIMGSSISINNVTFPTGNGPAITLLSNGDQAFTSNVAWSAGNLSAFGINSGNTTGNAIKSVGSSVVGGTLTLGWIQMGETGASGTTTLKLTSDIVSIGSTQLNAQNGAGSANTVTLGIDANGHTLDLTANTGVTAPWTPNGTTVGGGGSKVVWLLSNSAGAGATGKIRAQGFNFSVGTGSGISVGSNVTLESVGTSVANNLSAVAGSIDPTSTFLYNGTATSASPATLTSTRNIGNLAVNKGALKIAGNALVAAGAVTVDAGGTLDLSSFGVTAGGGLVLGSSTASGLITGNNNLVLTSTSGGAVAATLISGTVNGGISSGAAASTVTKTGAATTVVMNGVNSYLGATSVSEGRLNVNGSLAAASNVTVASAATLGGSGTIYGLVVNSGTITGSLTFGNNVTVNSGATASATAFNGDIVNNGTISSAVNVQGGKVLSGSGLISNAVTVNGTMAPGDGVGTLTVNGSLTLESTAKLVLEVTGKTPGSYDQLVVNGDITLGGTLDLTSFTGLTVGDPALTLIDNTGTGAATGGAFTSILTSEGIAAGTLFGKTYTFSFGGTDYVLNYAANTGGDGSFNDVTLAAVPEPGTWAMLVGGLGMLLWVRTPFRRRA